MPELIGDFTRADDRGWTQCNSPTKQVFQFAHIPGKPVRFEPLDRRIIDRLLWQAFVLCAQKKSTSKVVDVVKANMDGEAITPFSFDRAVMPSGKSTAWEVPTLMGSETVKSIEGIIVHVARRRSFWRSKDPSKNPPDCQSLDMTTGHGDPGGQCDLCPFNQWGSATAADGSPARGKACSESRLLFLVRKDDRLPFIVKVPSGSLRAWSKFMQRLTNVGLPIWGVVTRLELETAQNHRGTSYPQIKPSAVAMLDADSIQALRQYAATFFETFAKVTIEESEPGDREE